MAEPTTEEQNKGKKPKHRICKGNLSIWAEHCAHGCHLALTFLIIFREYSADDILAHSNAQSPLRLMGSHDGDLSILCCHQFTSFTPSFSDRKTRFSLSHRTAHWLYSITSHPQPSGQPMECTI